MSAKDVCDRLREHSGLPVATQQLGGLGFADAVEATKKGGVQTGLEKALDDVIDCLQPQRQESRCPGSSE
jgi:hypothetical protein